MYSISLKRSFFWVIVCGSVVTQILSQIVRILINGYSDVLRSNLQPPKRTRNILQIVLGIGDRWSTIIMGDQTLSVFTDVYKSLQEYPLPFLPSHLMGTNSRWPNRIPKKDIREIGTLSHIVIYKLFHYQIESFFFYLTNYSIRLCWLKTDLFYFHLSKWCSLQSHIYLVY